MTPMAVVKILIGTVVVSLILALGTNYFLTPSIYSGIERPAELPAPGMPRDTAVKDILAMSKDHIRGADQDGFEPGTVWRNPFIWPDEQKTLVAGPDIPVEPFGEEINPRTEDENIVSDVYKLKLTMIGEREKRALINRSMVHEGDTLDNNRVSLITPLSVVLTTPDNQDITLSMQPPMPMIAHTGSSYDVKSARGDGGGQDQESKEKTLPSDDDLAGQRRYLKEELLRSGGGGGGGGGGE